MERVELIKKFNLIKELTDGNNTSNSDIIDYDNGFSITINEIETEYYKYCELVADIDDYINDNDLDDVLNQSEIKEHFSNIKDYFELNQAVLIDFVDFMVKIIEEKIKVK